MVETMNTIETLAIIFSLLYMIIAGVICLVGVVVFTEWMISKKRHDKNQKENGVND